jgi:hypothetical protein
MQTFVIPLLILNVSGGGEVKMKQQNIKVEYDGVIVNSLSSDINTTSLIINITASDSGVLQITIPKTIIDSTYNNDDDVFYIIIDGEEIEFKETITKNHRTLEIPYTKQSQQIEIIGTDIIDDLETIGTDLALATMIKL